jgi:hypothetical protein
MKLLLVADKANSRNYYQARECLNGFSVSIPKVHYGMLSPYISSAKKQGITAILLSHSAILAKLVYKQTHKDSKTNNSLNAWAGTIFKEAGIDILVVKPFSQLVTMDYTRFLLRQHVRKLVKKEYYTPAPFTYEILNTQASKENAYELFKTAICAAVDIETTLQTVSEVRLTAAEEKGMPVAGLWTEQKNSSKAVGAAEYIKVLPMIDMVGYCGLFRDADGKLTSHSVVLYLHEMEDIYWMRKFNSLPCAKIMQNGGYDSTHFIRYNAPIFNWLGDTFHMAHCQYAEMPRKLNELASMWLADFEYWKDEMGSNRAEYNAKDCHYTLWTWVFQVRELQPYARTNYLIEFRKVFPDICCGLEGFKVDPQEVLRLAEKYQKVVVDCQASLDKIVYVGFNSNSPKQVLELLNAISVTPFKGTDKKDLQRFSEKGAINLLIVDKIRDLRKARKKLSTYIHATLMDGRLLYELNHGGTDTARTASKASNLWCGTQIQNIDAMLRSMYIADLDWELNNQDGSQAESRTTGYISEDATLINTVETAPDFHARNASLFFGLPESDIIRIEKDIQSGKQTVVVINKPLRKLSKPVNHGSNYNMGASVLLQTMGTKMVLDAKKLIGLPSRYGVIQTCEYLLNTFEQTYPDVKGKYYDEVFEEIAVTGRLVGSTGWTRICFGRPVRNGHKPTINKYVAHLPQSLSAMILDEAYVDFWLEYQIKQQRARLKAPVHDEVVFQSRPEDSKELRDALGVLVSRPYTVRGRTLIIPTDGGGNGYRWSELK